MRTVEIGNSKVGPGNPCYIIGEIGINHNGDIDVAKHLISEAAKAGVDAVKFQKRTVDVVYSAEELARSRISVFGDTNGDLKRGLEFSMKQFQDLYQYCHDIGIDMFASCWDINAVDEFAELGPSCYKIASASLTDHLLLAHIRSKDKPVILSTGMSTLREINEAMEVLGYEDTILLHCTSTYPAKYSELNLRAIHTLGGNFNVPIGYSGHETGLATSVAAVAMGACVVERHITLDRAMWGSDQAASVEPAGIARMVKDIRAVEMALGDGRKVVYDSEVPVRDKLRRV